MILQPHSWAYNLKACCAMLNHFSCIQLFVTLLTVARQAPLLMGFSRQEYWNGLPCPRSYPEIEPGVSYIFCTGKWVLYHLHHLGSPVFQYQVANFNVAKLQSLLQQPNNFSYFATGLFF